MAAQSSELSQRMKECALATLNRDELVFWLHIFFISGVHFSVLTPYYGSIPRLKLHYDWVLQRKHNLVHYTKVPSQKTAGSIIIIVGCILPCHVGLTCAWKLTWSRTKITSCYVIVQCRRWRPFDARTICPLQPWLSTGVGLTLFSQHVDKLSRNFRLFSSSRSPPLHFTSHY